MKARLFGAILVLSVVAGIFTAGEVVAQSIFLEPNTDGGVHLEALKLGLSNVDFTAFSFAYFLSAAIPVGDGLRVRLELPFVYFKRDAEDYYYYGYQSSPESTSGFGNPYLGVDVGNLYQGFSGEFGCRLPVMESDYNIAAFGLLSDPIERPEAFTPDVLSVMTGLNYRHRSDNGFALRLRMVPVFWLPVGDNNGDPDLFVMYSAQAWYEDRKVGVGAGFSGRGIITGDDLDIGERTIHQFGLFTNFLFGNVMPGFQVRFPLDGELSNVMTPTFSISIGIRI